ncbi:MAG: hypothetical protein KBD64_07780 [Gammaproteobacteria bacterium]|nr:hypothetical protein [Gammaproteobacteria bacterium]
MGTLIKLFLTFFMLSLAFVSLYSKAATCPDITTISRISGEYKWKTSVPRWSGYFVAPQIGSGRSYVVKKFLAASWVKSHDTIDSTGFIQCDYIGDFGYAQNSTSNTDPNKQYEIIRFVQTNSNGAYAPSVKSGWTCKAPESFPNETCSCFGIIERCVFQIG